MASLLDEKQQVRSDIEDALQGWLDSLKVYPITENMLRWMSSYDHTCDRACCHATQCASIRCTSCKTSLTKLPLPNRYQCIECEGIAM